MFPLLQHENELLNTNNILYMALRLNTQLVKHGMAQGGYPFITLLY